MEEQIKADSRIRKLADYVLQNPDAQYSIHFKGRSMPATLSECYDVNEETGFSYTVLSFWDDDSGNMFDVDYRLVPEAVYANGEEISY